MLAPQGQPVTALMNACLPAGPGEEEARAVSHLCAHDPLHAPDGVGDLRLRACILKTSFLTWASWFRMWSRAAVSGWVSMANPVSSTEMWCVAPQLMQGTYRAPPCGNDTEQRSSYGLRVLLGPVEAMV
jgi:hypothetical protein